MNNPAAAQGWVKSTDPNTGRVFYANHITRKTQWDPPADWVDEPPPPPPKSSAPYLSHTGKEQQDNNNGDDDENEPLPSNWEIMHDPTTGKPFYVDHERKITTWTRPKQTDTPQQSFAASLKPAIATSPPTSGNLSSAALARILQQQELMQQQTTSQQPRSWQQEASYYTTSLAHSSKPTDVDFSDALPPLSFEVKKVADALRDQCAHCPTVFSMSKRRHHCRLCGDVFCDACSNHRVTLPLPGSEFDKPVRVCDYCHADVEQGNFFSFRRYLTPLHLSEPGPNLQLDEDNVASASNVNAAMYALAADVEQMLSSPDEGHMDRVRGIPPSVLIPELLKHLSLRETSDRALRAIASLLALEHMMAASKSDAQYELSAAVYLYGKQSALDDIIGILERSGSERRTLFVQEQAARTLCYLTEPAVVSATLKHHVTASNGSIAENYYLDNRKSAAAAASESGEYGSVDALDIPRAMRSMLDHSSNTRNPNLQRWSTAGIKHLVIEDQRRTCLAVNDVAAAVASGEAASEVAYQSFLEQLVSTGGVMILGSLVGTDDADTRAHAVAALAATLASTRAIDSSLTALSEMTGGAAGYRSVQDASVIRAIVAGGGCSSSVAQLLLSADHGVAGMGCQFLSSLVMPLLADPTAGANLHSNYDYRSDESAMGACREAAVEVITSGGCLPALLSLVRENGSATRPIDLRKRAMETVAAVVYAVGEMGRVWSKGKYEAGLDDAPGKLQEALLAMQHEGVMDTALSVLQSGAGQSLGSGGKETPYMRIREAAGIVLGAVTSCSAEAILDLQSRQILSSLLLASTESSMTAQSTMRGDSSPRCLGVLETVSSVLMFAWQHPSGASSELLDRLIEAIDAGAIPYLSRVMNSKIDWESRDKSVGAMKGRTAACRMLCCLFGIALTDPTAIGMRRLMEAVETDARSYRGGERAPSNLIESALAALQASSNLARKALLGTLSQGAHYQAALMDLVDSSLLAAGSMCGSSVAPGGSEGTLISGESFLSERTDTYVGRRNDICKVACDVVVRGGRSGPALLPTMMVGGFGEGAVLSSLRLALAIAQNGTKDQHQKLALSGILVPVSDILRSALTRGDLYKFSAALALVRFCGPHIAAGHGGGLESVRDAIRIATNVLTLPVNPNASLKQIETQESLKSECIAALESLSHNASLWSSISSDALPSIISFLQGTSSAPAVNPQRQRTRCAALKAVLQIVQVPSHAVSAAGAGLAEALGRLISAKEASSEEDEMAMLALEILHVIAANDQARRTARFLDTGLARCIFAALGKAATDQPRKPSDSRADVTFLGLEILLGVLSDIETGVPTPQILQSPGSIAFLDAVATEPSFIRAMCSTLLLKTNMKIPRHDSDSNLSESYDIPKCYGPPFILVQEACGGHENTHDASAALLFRTAVYACAIESKRSDAFWKAVLLRDSPDDDEASRAAASLCAHFLSLLALDHKPFLPVESEKKEDFVALTRPLVRHRLLEALKDFMGNLSGEVTYGPSADPFMTSLLVGFNVPHICLSVWRDPALLDLSFQLLRQIVEQDPDEVLHLFVQGKAAMESLFDLLNVDSTVDSSQNVGEIKSFLASVLGQIAENGMLAEAVEKYDVRSSAISALASACLSEEERPTEEDEDMTSERLSSVLMRCLVDLCSVTDTADSSKKRIKLSPIEAETMAKNLGEKICKMVISRFLERARLKQYEMDDEEDIMDAPDVSMLCAIAQHRDALHILKDIGGLHALSLVAAEGEISAIIALQTVCQGDASVLLEGETFSAIMKMIADDDSDSWRSEASKMDLESSAFDLLSRLAGGSGKGRKAVATDPNFEGCVAQAMHIVSSFVTDSQSMAPTDGSESDEDPALEETDDEKKHEADASEGLGPDVLQLREVDDKEIGLGVAACSFLAAVVSTKGASLALNKSKTCVRDLCFLAKAEGSTLLSFAASTLLSALAPYASSHDVLTPETIADVILFLLVSEKKITATDSMNLNRLVLSSCTALSSIFDSIPEETQVKLVKAVAKQFSKGVKGCIVTRTTTKDEERALSAEASYSMTVILLLARGRDFASSIFSQDVLTSMMHLLQWRCDPKTSVGSTNERYWDAAVSNSLLLVSTIVWKSEEKLKEAGVDLKGLGSTTLMLARAGKAPRRAIDVKSALSKVTEGKDAAAAAAAARISERLFS